MKRLLLFIVVVAAGGALFGAAAPAAEPGRGVEAEVRGLIRQLDGGGMDSQVRARNAMKKLIRIGKPAVPPLVEATSHKSLWVRLWSIAALCGIGDQRAIEPAIDLMTDRAKLVRMIATWHGSGFARRDKRVATAIGKNVRDPEHDVRHWARRAIVDRKLEGLDAVVEAALDDPDPGIREDAFITLAMMRGQGLLKNARHTIKSDGRPRRLSTAYLMLQRGTPDMATAELFLVGLGHADAEVRDAAVQGLEWILKEGTKQPDAAAKARGRRALTGLEIEKIQGTLEKKLPAMLSSEHAPLRAHALYLLTAGKRGALLPEIEKALKDPEPIVRAHALRSLARAQLQDKRTLEHALAALSDGDEEVRKVAWMVVRWVTDGRIAARFDPAATDAEREAQAKDVREAAKIYLH